MNFTRKWPESAGLMLIITTLLCIKWKMKSLQFSMLPRLSMETMEKAAELLIQDQQYLKGTWWLHGRKILPMPSYLITSESQYRDMVSQSSIRSLKKMLESGQISRIWKKWRATQNNVKIIELTIINLYPRIVSGLGCLPWVPRLLALCSISWEWQGCSAVSFWVWRFSTSTDYCPCTRLTAISGWLQSRRRQWESRIGCGLQMWINKTALILPYSHRNSKHSSSL